MPWEERTLIFKSAKGQHNMLWAQFLVVSEVPKIWNNLPDVVRALSDFETFKKLLENESLF